MLRDKLVELVPSAYDMSDIQRDTLVMALGAGLPEGY